VSKKRGRLPSVRPAEVIRLLLRNGFRELRATKHRHITDDAQPPHVVTVPYYQRALKLGTLQSIIRQAGWSPGEFLEKL
jgi:predicted RNA binding protein YcfA (HicA-like mRNA interferase family)